MTIRQLLSAAVLCGALATSASAGEVRFTGQGHAYNPAWSPNGRYLAFEVNNYDDKTDLHVSVLNGAIAEDARKVSLPGATGPFGSSQVVVNPVWHPTNNIVFEGSNAGGQYRLYFYQPTGAAAYELIPATAVKGDLTFPAFDAKGNLMAFVADETGAGDIRIRDNNSSSITTVMSSSSAEMFPQFNENASKILFTRKHNNSEDVFEVDVATGQESPVVGGSQDQTRPTYAAGGRILFFDNSRDNSQWDLASVTGPGGTKKVMAKSVRLPHRARPALTPDGQWVAVTFEDPAKANSVVLMKVDGSKTVTIPTSYSACGEPSIGVQDGKVLLAYTALPTGAADYRKLYVVDITDKLQ
ncbi:MAG: PD40 domain-containing protein [Myxococcales bacterium]|nr:PD40 domain-containing protein [Myxococcales bacterium]MCB9668360.1 PD40 domain-containing protein [Alphaproteobacteria bacterium]